MKWAHEATCKAGDIVIADSGFRCLPEGAKRKVLSNDNGLYVLCSRHHHYLDGQLNEQGEYVGFYQL